MKHLKRFFQEANDFAEFAIPVFLILSVFLMQIMYSNSKVFARLLGI